MALPNIAAAVLGRVGTAFKGAKKAAKVKGYKAKEAIRVGKGKLKYKTATGVKTAAAKTAKKFPKTAAGAKKAKRGVSAGFSTFAKSKSGIGIKRAKAKTGKYLDKNLGMISVASSAGFVGGLTVPRNNNKKNPYA